MLLPRGVASRHRCWHCWLEERGSAHGLRRARTEWRRCNLLHAPCASSTDCSLVHRSLRICSVQRQHCRGLRSAKADCRTAVATPWRGDVPGRRSSWSPSMRRLNCRFDSAPGLHLRCRHSQARFAGDGFLAPISLERCWATVVSNCVEVCGQSSFSTVFRTRQ